MRLVVFCDARSDFEITSALIDRVLREHAIWISDVLDVAPEGIRTWVNDGRGHEFFDIHRIKDYALPLLRRLPQGLFNGEPGAAGAVMARTAFSLVRELSRQPGSDKVDGVILVWDMDSQAGERRRGLEQAREAMRKLVDFQIVLGRPDRMREAWVLAGFEPSSEAERARLDTEIQTLGFHPCKEAHLLTASEEQARRSAKRLVAVLTDGDRQREARCWNETALTTLRARGTGSGLTEFLEEIELRLVALCTGASSP